MNNKFGALLIGAFLLILMGQTGLFAQESVTQSPAEVSPILLKKDSVQFDPASPETGDKLGVKIKMTGEISSAEVRWIVNGEEVETAQYHGSEAVELNRPIKSGDVIEIEVVPYDLSGTQGASVQKKVVCRKAPPTLKLVQQKIEKNTYTARVEAKDAEDGPITLSLEGPPGMTIDDNGGITWQITEKTSGRFDVKVTATDKSGGKAVLDYSFRITRK
jgi:hypothetical protein